MMGLKQRLTKLLAIIFLSINTAYATDLSRLVEQMIQAHKEKDYELNFIYITGGDLTSLRYYHAQSNQKSYAQLFTLDNSRQEILQRDKVISYIGSAYQPFSLQGDAIVDYFPSILHGNIQYLKEHYDFVDMGRGRVADRRTYVIRIIPKDEFRYHYVVWLDEDTQLLLRSDLLDRNNQLLEQYRVISLKQSIDTSKIISSIEQLKLPPVIELTASQVRTAFNWTPSWLPKGFKLINGFQEQVKILGVPSTIERAFYSDGMFSFAIYVSDDGIVQNNLYWNNAGNSIYSENRQDKNITIIGLIPLSTAKRIVQDIHFKDEK